MIKAAHLISIARWLTALKKALFLTKIRLLTKIVGDQVNELVLLPDLTHCMFNHSTSQNGIYYVIMLPMTCAV